MMTRNGSPELLLINPWIYDFAAYDLWMKPMGLLYLGGYLRQHGYRLTFIDCLDRHDSDLLKVQGLDAPRFRAYGTGKFFRRRVEKPAALQQVPSYFCCYGIPEDIFLKHLDAAPPPDAILVTSMMTYWYPGVFRVIELVKQRFPAVPVILGGIYARLCSRHAISYSGADYIVQENAPDQILDVLNSILGYYASDKGASACQDASALFESVPAYDLYDHLDYACVLTSLGCPYHCTYCASTQLYPGFFQRDPSQVFADIQHWHTTRDIRHFAFYDDALLVNSATHLEPVLEQVIRAGLSCSFHTPNGLHARYVTEQLADLMFRAGFQTLRVSLETINQARQQATGGKVTDTEFEQAVHRLRAAGFQGHQIGVYLLAGLPGQDLAEVEATIHYVHDLGLLANLCQYSPIPGTPAFQALEDDGYIAKDSDPLLHNNSIFLYLQERHTFDDIQRLKDLARNLNWKIKR